MLRRSTPALIGAAFLAAGLTFSHPAAGQG
jgi:hypothetical protein